MDVQRTEAESRSAFDNNIFMHERVVDCELPLPVAANTLILFWIWVEIYVASGGR